MILPSILIVGATGGVGGSLLRQALALPSPPMIRASSRNIAQANFSSSVESVQGDLGNESTYHTLFNGIDRAFIYADWGISMTKLLSAAREGGVKKIVFLSSMTVDFDPEGLVGTIHRNAEIAIVESGLQYTFLRPRNFASNTRKFWVPTMQKTGKLWMTYPNAMSAPISDDDIASVALVSLTTDKLINQAIGLSGPINVSQREQVEAINQLRISHGESPIDLVIVRSEEWRQQVSDHMDVAFQDELLRWWAKTDGIPEEIQSSTRITDRPAQSYGDWLTVNKQAFLGFSNRCM